MKPEDKDTEAEFLEACRIVRAALELALRQTMEDMKMTKVKRLIFEERFNINIPKAFKEINALTSAGPKPVKDN